MTTIDGDELKAAFCAKLKAQLEILHNREGRIALWEPGMQAQGLEESHRICISLASISLANSPAAATTHFALPLTLYTLLILLLVNPK